MSTERNLRRVAIARQISAQGGEMNAPVVVEQEPAAVENRNGAIAEAVGRLGANELHRERIPEAAAELEEARELSAQAADAVMAQAEALMETQADAAMALFEICTFQDLLGQRVGKALELLETLEGRLGRLAEETGVADAHGALCAREQIIEQRRKELILHGPQDAGEGVSQDDIDALLGA